MTRPFPNFQHVILAQFYKENAKTKKLEGLNVILLKLEIPQRQVAVHP
jgi:hypothetical protein